LLPGNDKPQIALSNVITPEYFSTLKIPLLQGRGFSSEDTANSMPVAVVSRGFAEKCFSGSHPVGKVITIGDASETRVGAQNSRQAVVIGVVGNARQRSLSESTEPQIYFTYPQVTGIFGTLVVRTAVKPESLIDAVKQAVWSVDKEQPVWQIRT